MTVMNPLRPLMFDEGKAAACAEFDCETQIDFQRRGIGEKGEVLGEFQPTGIRPKLAERLEMAGVHLPFEMFEKAPVRR